MVNFFPGAEYNVLFKNVHLVPGICLPCMKDVQVAEPGSVAEQFISTG